LLGPLLENRDRPTHDPDQDWLTVPDVRPHRAQDLLMVDATDHDEGRPIAEARLEVGELEVARHELPLLADVSHGVRGERLEGLADAAATRLVRARDGRAVLHLALPDELVAAVAAAGLHAHPPPILPRVAQRR